MFSRCRWLVWSVAMIWFSGLAQSTNPVAIQALDPVHVGAPTPIRYFGQSQAVDGELLAVGAPYSTGGGANVAGSVFIFRRNGAVWSYLQALQAPVPEMGDGFGYGITLVGSNLLIGAPFGNFGRGAFYIYEFNPTINSFVLAQSIPAPMDVAISDWFGLRGAVHNGWMAIGAPSISEAGAVYLYRFDAIAETWVFHSKVSPNALSPRRFGFSLALHNDQLVVGSPADDEGNNEQGNVYAFSRTGNGSSAVWNLNQRFRMTTDAGANAAQLFGFSLSMGNAGTELAVGMPLAGQLGGGTPTVVGAVFMFQRTGNTWTQTARLDSPLSGRKNFGVSLHRSGGELLVGDPQDGSSGAIRGAATLFRLADNGSWVPTTSWKRVGGIIGGAYGVSVAIAGNQFVVGDSGADEPGATDRGIAFVHGRELLSDGFE